MFPFTVLPAYNLPVYASERPLPDATQDSVRGCSLGFCRGRHHRRQTSTRLQGATLIELSVRISRSGLSDWLHRNAHVGARFSEDIRDEARHVLGKRPHRRTAASPAPVSCAVWRGSSEFSHRRIGRCRDIPTDASRNRSLTNRTVRCSVCRAHLAMDRCCRAAACRRDSRFGARAPIRTSGEPLLNLFVGEPKQGWRGVLLDRRLDGVPNGPGMLSGACLAQVQEKENSVAARRLGGAAMQITESLDKLGLGQYAQRVAENDIDFPILGDLTATTSKRSASRSDIAARCYARLPTSKISRKSRPRSRLRRPPGNGRWTPPSAATSR